MIPRPLAIAPYMKIAVIDASPTFRRRLRDLLKIIGFGYVATTSSLEGAGTIVELGDVDIIFIELSEYFNDTLCAIGQRQTGGPLVIGVSDDKSGKTWIQAIEKGADTILLRQHYPSLLRPMLSHLMATPAAWRCKIVQFPALDADGRMRGSRTVDGR